MAARLSRIATAKQSVSEKPFFFPRSALFTYDAQNKVQTVYGKNVYDGYLSSAEKRSTPEKKFEKFCENCPAVEWIYKNGDKGEEFFSIVYVDNSDRQKLFYPDYIVCVKGEIWIIETKGGFGETGESEDIDIYSEKKFQALKTYLAKYGLKGGFVRFDKQSDELCVSTENYGENVRSDDWKILKEVFK